MRKLFFCFSFGYCPLSVLGQVKFFFFTRKGGNFLKGNTGQLFCLLSFWGFQKVVKCQYDQNVSKNIEMYPKTLKCIWVYFTLRFPYQTNEETSPADQYFLAAI